MDFLKLIILTSPCRDRVLYRRSIGGKVGGTSGGMAGDLLPFFLFRPFTFFRYCSTHPFLSLLFFPSPLKFSKKVWRAL